MFETNCLHCGTRFNRPARSRVMICSEDCNLQRKAQQKRERQQAHPECQADDCSAKVRSRRAGFCEAHYYRMRRNGTLELTYPQRDKRGICTIDGCGKTDTGPHGLCNKHTTRLKRNGHPEALRGPNVMWGEDNPQWSGDDVTYGPMHYRLRRRLGRAAERDCVDCGRQAYHWSYDYNDPDERIGKGGPFGHSVEHYSPRCVPCHRVFDAQHTATRIGA